MSNVRRNIMASINNTNILYELTNEVFDGTKVINTDLCLFDGSIPNWKIYMDVTWSESKPQQQATLLDSKIDGGSLNEGMLVRWKTTNVNEFGIAPNSKVKTESTNMNTAGSTYGFYMYTDNSKHFILVITKQGNNIEFIYNDTKYWRGSFSDYTNSKKLYLGANNSDNIGLEFRRYFIGTINKFILEKL